MRIILLFILLSSFYSHATPNTLFQSCLNKCSTPFGNKLGENKGVIGYSNCNPDCESEQWYTIKIGEQPHRSGMKWQCVEYARRWYMLQLGYTFSSIDHAYQIWDLVEAEQLGSAVKKPWNKFSNGLSIEQPQANDLLIYNKEQGIHGHVSVIVKVAHGYVYLAEQNYSNTKWESPTYARKARLIKSPQGHYTIEDLGVIGWLRLDKKRILSPK